MTGSEYRFVVGVGTPLVLTILGVLTKRIRRGMGPGWRRSDFYLGSEFTLAGVAAALVNIAEIFLNPERPWKDSYKSLGFSNFGVGFFGLILFLFVISLHEELEHESNVGDARSHEIMMLAVVANVLGFIALVIGVILTPGAA
jgi:hypothetical protein